MEFWAWAEAARIHRDEQPDLAIACFCQALRLNAKARFLGKIHRELAELLADAANPSQATREAMMAVEIYDQQGWKHPTEVQALLQSDWYDPSLVAEEPSQFYSQHAKEALALCFDEVREYSATYLGMTEGREGKKPKPRFAVRTGDGVASILGRRGASLLETRHAGSPVNLLIGIEGSRRDVLEVLPRPDGSEWDCMETREGVISLRPANGDSITVYCDRDREMRVAEPSARKAMDLGAGVRVWGVTNPASGRFEVHKIESTAVPQHADIGLFTGRLSRTNKGFGFVGDVFVPAPLVELVPQDALDCAVVAVMKFDKTKQRYSWRAVAISSCHCSKTGNR
jgi:hypothetical protein